MCWLKTCPTAYDERAKPSLLGHLERRLEVSPLGEYGVKFGHLWVSAYFTLLEAHRG